MGNRQVDAPQGAGGAGGAERHVGSATGVYATMAEAAAARIHPRIATGSIISRHAGRNQAGEGAVGGSQSPELGVTIPWQHPGIVV